MEASSAVIASSSSNDVLLSNGYRSSASEKLSNGIVNVDHSPDYAAHPSGTKTNSLHHHHQQPLLAAARHEVPASKATRQSPFAFFSTNGRQFPARELPDPKPLPIVRTDPKRDARRMIASLRARWPHQSSGIFARSSEGHAQWDITWFFDEYDFYVLGGEFCYNLILTMQKENENHAVHVANDWSQRNREHFPWMPNLHIGISAVFAPRDREMYGDEFLKQVLGIIRQAVEKPPASLPHVLPEQRGKDQQIMIHTPGPAQAHPNSCTVPMMPVPPHRVQNGPFVPYYSFSVLPPLEEVPNGAQRVPMSPQADENKAQPHSWSDRGSKRGRGNSIRGRRGRGFSNNPGRRSSLSNSNSSTEHLSLSSPPQPIIVPQRMHRSDEPHYDFEQRDQHISQRFFVSPRPHSKSDDHSPRYPNISLANPGHIRVSQTDPTLSPRLQQLLQDPNTPASEYEAIDPSETAYLVTPKFVGKDVEDVLELHLGNLDSHIDDACVRRLIENVAAVDSVWRNPKNQAVFVKLFSTADIRKALVSSPLGLGAKRVRLSVPFKHCRPHISKIFPTRTELPNIHQAGFEHPSARPRAQPPHHTALGGSENQEKSPNRKTQPQPCENSATIYSPQDARSCMNPPSQQPNMASQPAPQVPPPATWPSVVTTEFDEKPKPPQDSPQRAVPNSDSQKNNGSPPKALAEERNNFAAENSPTKRPKSKRNLKKKAAANQNQPGPSNPPASDVKAEMKGKNLITQTKQENLDKPNNEQEESIKSEDLDKAKQEQGPSLPKQADAPNLDSSPNSPAKEFSSNSEKPGSGSNAKPCSDSCAEPLASHGNDDEPPSCNEIEAKTENPGLADWEQKDPASIQLPASSISSNESANGAEIGNIDRETLSSDNGAAANLKFEDFSSIDNENSNEQTDIQYNLEDVEGQTATEGDSDAPQELDQDNVLHCVPSPTVFTPESTASSSTEVSPTTESLPLLSSATPAVSEDEQVSKKDKQSPPTKKTPESPSSSKKKGKQTARQSRSASPPLAKEAAAKTSLGPDDLAPWIKEYENAKEVISKIENKIRKVKSDQEVEILKQQLAQFDSRYSQVYQKYQGGTKSTKKTARKSLTQIVLSQREKYEELVLLHSRVKSHRDSPLSDPSSYPALHKPTASEEVESLGPKRTGHKSSQALSIPPSQQEALVAQQPTNLLKLPGWDAVFFLVEPRSDEDGGRTLPQEASTATSVTLVEDETDNEQAFSSPKTSTTSLAHSPPKPPTTPLLQSPPKSYAAVLGSASSSFSPPPNNYIAPASPPKPNRSKSAPSGDGTTNPGTFKKRKWKSGSGDWQVGPEGEWGRRGTSSSANGG